MTNIAEMLTEDQREALAAIKAAAPAKPEPPKAPAQILGHPDLPPVTTINGVDVDLRSDGRFETACADCETPLEVEIKPEGVDLAFLTSKPRVAVCLPCAEKRVQGKQVAVVHRPAVPELTTKGENELDLSTYSDAELASVTIEARDRMIAERAEALPAKREAAMQAKAEADAKDDALKAQERAEQGQRKKWMGEFTLHGVLVPSIDFTEVGLDELVPPKARSPYNKALHASGEPILDREGTTYRTLRKVHKSLWKQAEVAVEAPKKAEPKAERLLAEVDPAADAKVKAFAQVMSLSTEEARERLAALSLV